MADPRGEPHWRSAVDVPLIVLATATVLSLVRSIDQPSFSVDLAGTEVEFVLADAALAVLAGFCLQRLLGRGSLPRPARAVTLAAAAFSTWLLLSSAANGADAVIAAAKLLEYGMLALGFVLFVRRRLQFWLLVGVLVAFTVVAVGYGLLAFLDAPFVDVALPDTAPAFVPRRARPRRSVDDDARCRACGPVRARAPPRPTAARRRRRGSRSVSSWALRVAGLLGPLPRGRGDRRDSRFARGAATKRALALTRGDDSPHHDRCARPSLGRPGSVPPLPRDRGAAGRSVRKCRELE